MTVEHVEVQACAANAFGAVTDARDRGLFETVGACDRNERGHLADAGREHLDLAAEVLVSRLRAVAHAVADADGDGHRERVDRQERGDGDRRHGDRADHDHRRRQQRMGHLLQHQLDVLDVAHDLGLHDRGAHARVVPDRQALQAGREGIAQVGAGVADHGHEAARVEDVVRVVLQQQDHRERQPPEHGRDLAPVGDDVDDRRRDDREEPQRDLLHGEGEQSQRHPPGAAREQAKHGARRVGRRRSAPPDGKALSWPRFHASHRLPGLTSESANLARTHARRPRRRRATGDIGIPLLSRERLCYRELPVGKRFPSQRSPCEQAPLRRRRSRTAVRRCTSMRSPARTPTTPSSSRSASRTPSARALRRQRARRRGHRRAVDVAPRPARGADPHRAHRPRRHHRARRPARAAHRPGARGRRRRRRREAAHDRRRRAPPPSRTRSSAPAARSCSRSTTATRRATARCGRSSRTASIGEVTSIDFQWMLDTKHGADYFRRWHREKKNSGGLLSTRRATTSTSSTGGSARRPGASSPRVACASTAPRTPPPAASRRASRARHPRRAHDAVRARPARRRAPQGAVPRRRAARRVPARPRRVRRRHHDRGQPRARRRLRERRDAELLAQRPRAVGGLPRRGQRHRRPRRARRRRARRRRSPTRACTPCSTRARSTPARR